MALPLSTAADGEEDLMHGSYAAGYSQLPADHFSDSSESSYADDLMYDTCDVFYASEAGVVRHNSGRSDAPSGSSPSHQNGGSVPHVDGTGNGALIYNSNVRHDGGMDNQAASNASHENGSHMDAQTDNGVLYSNVGHNHMQNHTDSHDAPHGRHVVHIDGMVIHVYGQLAGLQLSAPFNHANIISEDVDAVEDVDEDEWQQKEDTAMLRATEEEEARRLAPLPPERCQAIRTAMQSISLGGYRPEWADKIPEEQWLNRLRRS